MDPRSSSSNSTFAREDRSGPPEFVDDLRRRLGRRYASAIDAWLDGLPGVLEDFAGRWGVAWGTPIPRGMVALEIAEVPGGSRDQVATLLSLASRV